MPENDDAKLGAWLAVVLIGVYTHNATSYEMVWSGDSRREDKTTLLAVGCCVFPF